MTSLIASGVLAPWTRMTSIALVVLVGALPLAGCGATSGAQAPLAAPAATGAHVYYIYPTGVTVPSGATQPTGGAVVALDAASGAVIWRRPTHNPLFQPTEISHVVYVSSYTDDPRTSTLDALDPRTGKALWSHATPGTFVNPPVVVGGAVYVSASQQDSGGYGGVMQALDERSGAARWQVSTDGTPSPAAADGQIIYVTSIGSPFGVSALFALDAATGHMRWRYDSTAQLSTLDPSSHSDALLPPMPTAGLVITISTIRDSHGFALQSALALDAVSGKPRWEYSTDGIAGAPVIADGTLYISADVVEGNGSYSTLAALRITDGTLLWRQDAGGDPAAQVNITSVAFVEGAAGLGSSSEPRLLLVETRVINGTTNAAVLGLIPRDGHTRWATNVGQFVIREPLLAGDLALIQAGGKSATNRGTMRMLAIQPSDGAIRWRQDIGNWPVFNDDTPWVDGGSIYDTITRYNGNTPQVSVVALRIMDGARQWQWRVGSA